MYNRLALVLALAMVTISLVGCGGNTNSDSNSNSETEPLEVTEAVTTIEDTIQTELTEDISETFEETTEDSGDSTSEVDLQAMVDYITSNVEWASLMQIEDPDLISEYFTLDATDPNYKQLLVSQCPMSAVVAEIILIQAEDVQSAKDALNARRDKLINTDTYYPEHVEIAEESIIGNVGDIVYFIAGENAQESEDVLVGYLNQ
jgi:hypothetical protein